MVFSVTRVACSCAVFPSLLGPQSAYRHRVKYFAKSPAPRGRSAKFRTMQCHFAFFSSQVVLRIAHLNNIFDQFFFGFTFLISMTQDPLVTSTVPLILFVNEPTSKSYFRSSSAPRAAPQLIGRPM